MKELSRTFGVTTLILIVLSILSLITLILAFSGIEMLDEVLLYNITLAFGPSLLEISILIGIINVFLGEESRKRGLNAIFLCLALLLPVCMIISTSLDIPLLEVPVLSIVDLLFYSWWLLLLTVKLFYGQGGAITT